MPAYTQGKLFIDGREVDLVSLTADISRDENVPWAGSGPMLGTATCSLALDTGWISALGLEPEPYCCRWCRRQRRRGVRAAVRDGRTYTRDEAERMRYRR